MYCREVPKLVRGEQGSWPREEDERMLPSTRTASVDSEDFIAMLDEVSAQLQQMSNECQQSLRWETEGTDLFMS